MIEVSFIIPTLNAQSVLASCLKSIKHQYYSSSKYEILVIDGGSSDKTISIAQKYGAKVLKNPLKTAEAGKAVGVRSAAGKFVCLIDSDNLLSDPDWLQKMLFPFSQNRLIIGSEPISFNYRRQSGIIERYSALIGANDPYAFVTGVYDRKNYLNNKWTGLKIDQIDKDKYILINLKPNQQIPTIGANGTIFRLDFLKKNLVSDYLFDIDIISQVIRQTNQPLFFAKVKVGITHTYCESSIAKFIRKQKRRLTDYFFYRKFRHFDWDTTNRFGIIKFILYTCLFLPAIFDSFRGFIHKPDLAWFFHPLACWLTLINYSVIYLRFYLGNLGQTNRENWKQ